MTYQWISFGAVLLFVLLLIVALFLVVRFTISKKYRKKFYRTCGKRGRFIVPGLDTSSKVDLSIPCKTIPREKRKVK